MPERHFREYQAFYNEQPFGLWREDYRTAQISHLLAMINRDPKSKAMELTEFMPFYKEKNTIDDEDDGSAEFLASR
ncbi:TPA: DUF4035 domain-containing protein [Pasteurella multocida]|uniref:phage tail assembly protein T n=1 Tax=Pasteurella multocida TaxID=747 RepID=UPI002945157D|nr:DUF4035 domain-containing protein [Pasteurella multocida]HDR1160594.1 DUF4035 domain-containing protein [Pasteurella multocida]HDR1190961.1 DUF4035 domain-containing protein [Pasteurella multocida]HDR1193190.1 DUF4035 domain-containing protein [Pasteurella multocida]HDR1200516.1 DUF4035 domain-containing protein [Pasteurella multocida]